MLHTAVLGLSVALLSMLVPCARGEDVKSGKQWIGVSCVSASDALRAQLKLDKTGLVVSKLHEDGPAAAEGMQAHDILLTANDKALANPEDLVDAIQEAGEKEIKLALLRGGERKEITVTPKPMPEYNSEPGTGTLFLNLIRPGQLVPPGEPQPFTLKWNWQQQELPENVTVTITKHGKDKVKIKVERDDKSWDVTEDKLNELPKDVRKAVEPMTRRFMVAMNGPIPAQDMIYITPSAPAPPLPPLDPNLSYTTAKAELTYRQALQQARAAQRTAEETLRHLEETYRPSKVLAEKVAPRVEGAVEQAKRWSLQHLDSRFDQVQKQLDELRGAVKAMREETPAAPAEPEAPAPPAKPALPAEPAPPAEPEAPKPPQA